MSLITYVSENIDSIINDLNIQIINPERRYWLIRAGEKGKFFNEFYTRGFTGIGYGIDDLDLLKNSTKEELKDLIAEKFPKEKQPGHIAGKLYNFFHEIKQGDIIIMPSAGRKKVAFGVVSDNEIFLDNSLFTGEALDCLDEEDEEDSTIPNKRRRIKWIKTVDSRFLQSKLILNLFSPHGLSGIADLEIIKLIDVNIDDFFLKEDYGYLSFQVKREKEINLNALSNLMNVLNEISSLYLDDEHQLSIQINLNSPGKIVVYGAKVTLIASLLILAFFGGKYKYLKDGEEHLVETKGAVQYFKEYLKHKEKMEELDIKYLEAINQLDIEESEKIKLIREKNKH